MSEKKAGGLAANLGVLEERTIVTVALPVPAVVERERLSNDRLKRMTMIVSEDFHARLKMHAAKARIRMEDIYREALQDYCVKNDVS